MKALHPGLRCCCACRRWALRMRSQNSSPRQPATGSRCVPCSRRSPPCPIRTPSCPSTMPSSRERTPACRWKTQRCSPSQPPSLHRTQPSSPLPPRWMLRKTRQVSWEDKNPQTWMNSRGEQWWNCTTNSLLSFTLWNKANFSVLFGKLLMLQEYDHMIIQHPYILPPCFAAELKYGQLQWQISCQFSQHWIALSEEQCPHTFH